MKLAITFVVSFSFLTSLSDYHLKVAITLVLAVLQLKGLSIGSAQNTDIY